MFDIVIDHLPEEQEMEVIRRTTIVDTVTFTPSLGAEDIVEFQKLVRRVPVADDVIRYAVRLVRMTRPGEPSPLDFVKNWVEYGASVRAAQYLVLGGKARALMLGHAHVGFDDIRALAKPVLRHRLLRTFAAESGRVSTDSIVDRVLERVTPPASNLR
jgi:MoxR-like ATPase